jgi:hypothetical protein
VATRLPSRPMGDPRMTVSGLGSPRTPRPSATPAYRLSRVEKPTARNDFEHLTGPDRDLIFAATGQRVGPGFDPGRDAPNGFATALAAERASGRLAPGQPVTAVYLKDLNRRCQRAPGPNPVAAHLDKALDHLARTGARRVDVSA